MLDSGEADTLRYTSNGWFNNRGLHAEGTKKKPIERGIFRQQSDLDLGEIRTSLYINTNKTADVTKQRSEEHTSELQSLMRISYAVFCLKKKKKHTTTQ